MIGLVKKLMKRYKTRKELMSHLPSSIMGGKNYNFANKVVKKSLKKGDKGGARLYIDEQLRKIMEQTKDTPGSHAYAKNQRKRLNYNKK